MSRRWTPLSRCGMHGTAAWRAFTFTCRGFASIARTGIDLAPVRPMVFDDPAAAAPAPYVANRAILADADALITEFGDDAGFEAAARAEASRSLGNVLHFARWRQIERLIVLLSGNEAVGTVH